MVDGAESLSSISDDGMILDDPNQMEDIRGLSDQLSITLLQILNSKVDNRNSNSWWSTGALRQLTYIDRTSRVENKLMPFIRLGLVNAFKISNLPSYAVTKRGVHGLLQIPSDNKQRKKYTKDGYCYRLRSEFIDLKFINFDQQTLFVPLENMHLENLKLLNILFRKRTMILLQAFTQENNILGRKDFTAYLNKFYNRLEEMNSNRSYDLTALQKLSKQYFRDNLSHKIYSQPSQEREKWFMIDREMMNSNQTKDRAPYLMRYSRNFDRIRFIFTNQMGERLRENNRKVHFHLTDSDFIYEPVKDHSMDRDDCRDDVINNGIIVDIQ